LPLISCKKCSATTSTEYSYCTNCGAPIPRQAAKQARITSTPLLVSSVQQRISDANGRLTILREALGYYRNSLLLLVPVAVSIVASLAYTEAFAQLGTIPSGQTLTSQAAHALVDTLLFGIMPYLLAFVVLNFLVTVGLLFMVGCIVREGRCKLSDWMTGIRSYFWRILNVHIVFIFLFGLVLGGVATLLLQAPLLLTTIASSLVVTLIELLIYFCCAAIILDNANLQTSIKLGINAIGASGGNFGILYVALFFELLVRWLVRYGFNLSANGPSAGLSSLSNFGFLNPQTIATTVLSTLLLPLWMIVIFILYISAPKNSP